MIAQVIEEIRASGCLLPSHTAFNGGHIPLCYPPLGFMLVAVSGVPVLSALLWLPLVFSALVPCAMVVLARRIEKSETAALGAGVCLAFLPFPYWVGLEGGGLTRSLGLLFLVLAISSLLGLIVSPSATRGVMAGLGVAGAVLSHPEGALVTFVLASLVLLRVRSREQVRAVAVATGVAAIPVASWVALVLARHGIDPWRAAAQGGDGFSSLPVTLSRLLSFGFTLEPGITLFGVLALLGVPIALARHRFFTVAWLVLPVYLVSRGARLWAAPAVALLAGSAIALIWKGLDEHSPSRVSRLLAQGLLAVFIVAHGFALAQASTKEISFLRPIPADDREVLAWLKPRLSPGEKVAVVGFDYGGIDSLAEWAPYLLKAENVVVPQGREWTGEFHLYGTRAKALRASLLASSDALVQWLTERPPPTWMVVGTEAWADQRVRHTLTGAAAKGALRLERQTGSATVWRIAASPQL